MKKDILKLGLEWLKQNKSAVLLYSQAVGVPAVAIAAACAVPSYEQDRKAKMDELNDELTWVEEGKIFAKHFWKAFALGALTEASIFVKDSWDKKNIAALAALAMSQENTIKDIKEAVVKTVGEKRAQEVEQTYANCKKGDESDLSDIVQAQIMEKEKPWIWQDLRFDTGYFLATNEEVNSACHYVERQVASGDTITASVFKDLINSKISRETDCCGWGPRDIGPAYGVPEFDIDGVKQLSDGTIIHLIDYSITWVDGEYLVESEYDN